MAIRDDELPVDCALMLEQIRDADFDELHGSDLDDGAAALWEHLRSVTTARPNLRNV